METLLLEASVYAKKGHRPLWSVSDFDGTIPRSSGVKKKKLTLFNFLDIIFQAVKSLSQEVVFEVQLCTVSLHLHKAPGLYSMRPTIENPANRSFGTLHVSLTIVIRDTNIANFDKIWYLDRFLMISHCNYIHAVSRLSTMSDTYGKKKCMQNWLIHWRR